VLAGVGLVVVLGAVWFFFLRGPTLAPVSGSVTFNGKPLAGADITFVNDAGDSYFGNTDDDGNYALKGRSGNQIPVGKYKVVVSKFKMMKVPDGEEGEEEERQSIPDVYSNEDQTTLNAVVAEDKKDYPFELLGKAPR
jgi:hypothetical protein